MQAWRKVMAAYRRVYDSAIDRYLPHACALQRTTCTSLLLSIDGTDRRDGRTDGRTSYRYIDAHC